MVNGRLGGEIIRYGELKITERIKMGEGRKRSEKEVEKWIEEKRD